MSSTSYSKSDDVPSPNADYDEIHRQLSDLADELDGWDIEVSQSPLTVPFIGLTNVDTIDSLIRIPAAVQVCILPVSESSFAVLPLRIRPTSVVATLNQNKSTTANVSWVIVPDTAVFDEAFETPERTLEAAVKRVRHICEQMN
jgi:hypothetical protein